MTMANKWCEANQTSLRAPLQVVVGYTQGVQLGINLTCKLLVHHICLYLVSVHQTALADI